MVNSIAQLGLMQETLFELYKSPAVNDVELAMKDAMKRIELKALEFDGSDYTKRQLNEARNYVSLELSRACGLPAYFTDSQVSSFTYSNALDKRRDLVDFAFRNYMSVIEQRMSFQDFTPQGNSVRFDLDDFLRGDPLMRAQMYEILNRIGAMSVDEIRAEEDLLL